MKLKLNFTFSHENPSLGEKNEHEIKNCVINNIFSRISKNINSKQKL